MLYSKLLESPWHYEYKMPNGVHVFGRRYEPFGPDNYPSEIKKVREMTEIRDSAIWLACKGEIKNLDAADALTTEIPEIETNYQDVHGSPEEPHNAYIQMLARQGAEGFTHAIADVQCDRPALGGQFGFHRSRAYHDAG